MVAAAATAAFRKTAEKTEVVDNNGGTGDSVANFLYSSTSSNHLSPSVAAHHHQHHHHYHAGDNLHYSTLSLAALAGLYHEDRLLASKSFSIADLRLKAVKAKKHNEALLLERTADKPMETVWKSFSLVFIRKPFFNYGYKVNNIRVSVVNTRFLYRLLGGAVFFRLSRLVREPTYKYLDYLNRILLWYWTASRLSFLCCQYGLSVSGAIGGRILNFTKIWFNFERAMPTLVDSLQN